LLSEDFRVVPDVGRESPGIDFEGIDVDAWVVLFEQLSPLLLRGG
jgi:hypothetical protein